MIRRRRLVGAALGLLVVAGATVGSPARAAQTGDFTAPEECADPPPPPVETSMTIDVQSPSGPDPDTDGEVTIDALVRNTSTRPVVGGSNGQVEEVTVQILACEQGQVPPEPLPTLTPAGDPVEARYLESARFPTNGRFAIVVAGKGSSPNGAQSARKVHPVQLAVPPAKPTNVKVTDPTNGVVNISWEYVDPPPDLIGFEVRRARQGSGDYTTVKNGVVTAKVRSVSDEPPVGAWRYHVVAYRNGAPDGAISRDDTVEVPEAAAAADPDPGSGAGAGGTASGDGTAGADDGTSTTAGTTPIGSANTPRASVDLSRFAAALNARRQPTARIEPPDPGFQETLPFATPDGSLEVEEEEPAELGADEPNVGLGQRVAADPAERRRSLGFVAFGLLLFVLSMTGLFLKGEVKRADLLALDLDEADDTDTPPDVPEAVPVPVSRRDRRAAVAGAAAPETSPELEPSLAPATAVAATNGRRRRPLPADRATDGEPTAAPAPVAALVPDTARRRRRPLATAVAEPAVAPAPLAAPGPSTNGRRRRPLERRPVAAASAAEVDHFDDLRDEVVAAPARAAAAAAPLDAPGLDVPDPVRAPRSTTRPPSTKKKAPLPKRAPAGTRRG